MKISNKTQTQLRKALILLKDFERQPLVPEGTLNEVQVKKLQQLGHHIQYYFKLLCSEKRVYDADETAKLVLASLKHQKTIAYNKNQLNTLLFLSDYFDDAIQSNMNELYSGIETRIISEPLDFYRKACEGYLLHLEKEAKLIKMHTVKTALAYRKKTVRVNQAAQLQQCSIIEAKIDFVKKLTASLNDQGTYPEERLEHFKLILNGPGSGILHISRTPNDRSFLSQFKLLLKHLLPTSFWKTSGEKLQETCNSQLEKEVSRCITGHS